MLSKKCVSCYNPKGKVASIPLDSYANVIKQVKPGNPTDSRLVQAVDGGSMSGRLTKKNGLNGCKKIKNQLEVSPSAATITQTKVWHSSAILAF